MYDASRAYSAKEEARMLRAIIIALASRPGGLRIGIAECIAVGDGDTFTMAEDPATKELVIEVTRR